MTDAERWVREHSQAKGSAWSVMLALAALADRCVAACTADQLESGARISRRELYRALLAQEELDEIERLSKVGSNKQLRAFHFARISCASTWGVSHPLCPRKQSPVPDLRIRNGSCAKKMLPFTRTSFSQEDCEECSGTGWRRIGRPDGEPGEVVIRCQHELAAMVGGRWKKPDSRDDPTWHPWLTEENSTPAAKQESFDWGRAALEAQMISLEEWGRANGVSVRAEAPKKNDESKKILVLPVRRCSGF
jgi:hypothetical protein